MTYNLQQIQLIQSTWRGYSTRKMIDDNNRILTVDMWAYRDILNMIHKQAYGIFVSPIMIDEWEKQMKTIFTLGYDTPTIYRILYRIFYETHTFFQMNNDNKNVERLGCLMMKCCVYIEEMESKDSYFYISRKKCSFL